MLSFDDRAGDLIASGITRYDFFETHDLTSAINGAGYENEMFVSTDEFLNEVGADKAELLEIIRNVTLELSWDGGQETVTLDCGELKYEK